MKEKKPQIILYNAWNLVFNVLPDEKAGQLIKAIFAHVDGDEVEPIKGLEKVMSEIFETIDADMEKYEQKRKQLQANAKQKQANAKQMLSNGEQIGSIKHKTYNIEHKTNNIEHIESIGEKSKRFIPPTPDEVKQYCLEKNFKVDEQRFVDFYSSKGWYVGKNKMKDWKAAVRNWSRESAGTKTESFEEIAARLIREEEEASGNG